MKSDDDPPFVFGYTGLPNHMADSTTSIPAESDGLIRFDLSGNTDWTTGKVYRICVLPVGEATDPALGASVDWIKILPN